MSKIIDTRDLHERLEELRALRDAITEAEDALGQACFVGGDDVVEAAEKALSLVKDNFSDDEKEELAELEILKSEVSEWRDGNALIPEDEFTEYAQDLCEDIGYIPKDLPSFIVIDWEATADNLKADYSEVEYQGTTYLYRVS